MSLKCPVQTLTLQELQIRPRFNLYLAVNKYVTVLNLYNVSRYILRNPSTTDVSIFGYIAVF